jgi:hypothetical protein
MKLINRPNIGKGLHRSGWVDAMAALSTVADGAGPLLDDCPEYTFLFGPSRPRPHTGPWIGIFHFPANVQSPFPQDATNNSAETLFRNPAFRESLPQMIGGIALASSLASWLHAKTGKPIATIKHPTATDVPQWSLEAFSQQPFLLQLGWHLRNTRSIFHQQPLPGWRYGRIAMYQDYQKRRDIALRAALGDEPNNRVEELPRLPNDAYDAALASCVGITEAFGMSACNVVVECIARGTPLLTRRCPESIEYLGADYPLYLDDQPALTNETLTAANRAMIRARGRWLECSYFAECVALACAQMRC